MNLIQLLLELAAYEFAVATIRVPKKSKFKIFRVPTSGFVPLALICNNMFSYLYILLFVDGSNKQEFANFKQKGMWQTFHMFNQQFNTVEIYFANQYLAVFLTMLL